MAVGGEGHGEGTVRTVTMESVDALRLRTVSCEEVLLRVEVELVLLSEEEELRVYGGRRRSAAATWEG